MSVRLGYGTNGLTDLRLEDALGVLAELGYDGVGLTLDHMHLDPFGPDLAGRVARIAARLDRLGLSVTVETGARYVLDPRRKHAPSLLEPEPEARAARTELLVTAVRVAADLGAHAVHCFSGVRSVVTGESAAWELLGDSLGPVLDAAAQAGVPLALEPEPGHLVQSLADFHRLRAQLGDHPQLGLTLDIGHCQCLEPLPPAECVRAAGPWLRHVQIEDMRRGVHEHLPFGDGEIDFPPVLAALDATGYQGLTVVELPRHSHAGPELARSSMEFLRAQLPGATRHPSPRSRPRPRRETRMPITREELPARLGLRGAAWIEDALAEAHRAAHRAPDSPRRGVPKWELRFAAAGRECGSPEATEAARVLLLRTARPDAAAVRRLYERGTGAERRAVLLALPHLRLTPREGVALVEDALRANDTGLVAAAVGPFATAHLDAHAWRHAVLKCLFTGVPLAAVAGLADRARGDRELARMLGDFAAERTAAGRAVPEDLSHVLALTAKEV